jgi:hypothetical protein
MAMARFGSWTELSMRLAELVPVIVVYSGMV